MTQMIQCTHMMEGMSEGCEMRYHGRVGRGHQTKTPNPFCRNQPIGRHAKYSVLDRCPSTRAVSVDRFVWPAQHPQGRLHRANEPTSRLAQCKPLRNSVDWPEGCTWIVDHMRLNALDLDVQAGCQSRQPLRSSNGQTRVLTLTAVEARGV